MTYGGARSAVIAVLAAAIVLVWAAPALADPAEPSHYEATILSLDPDIDGAAVEIAGGDAFLVLTVDAGHTAAVPGYSDEPYVRVDADGSVWVNLDSPTLYINEERYGRVDVPATADADAAPRWELVGGNGSYAWHDHRTHWMSFDRPPGVGGSERQVVFPWSIPIDVDGTEVIVMGRLDWLPSANPVWPVVVGAIAALPLLLPGRRPLVAGWLVIGGAATGLAVTIAQSAGTPAPARSLSALVSLPVLAVLCGALSLAARRRTISAWALLGGSLFVMAWVASTIDVLRMPVLISPLPAALERILVAAAAWAGVGALIVWLTRFREQLRPK